MNGTDMNDTDIELGQQLGRQLRSTSSRFESPAGLVRRVTERERHHRRRRAAGRAAHAALAAVAVVGGLVWVGNVRGPDPSSADQPAATPTALDPSANPDAVDVHPVVDWPGEPIPGVYASYGEHDDDQGWGGAIGLPGVGDKGPSSIVGVRVFPPGYDDGLPGGRVFSDAPPGRLPDTFELHYDGGTTVVSTVDDHPVVVFGADVDLLYEIAELVEPVEVDGQLTGYRFTSPLPAGVAELEAPQSAAPARLPGLSTQDGTTFVASIQQGGPLYNLTSVGSDRIEAITVNGRSGYRTTAPTPTITIAVSAELTLFLTSTTLTIDQLTDIARNVRLVDESTWNDTYAP